MKKITIGTDVVVKPGYFIDDSGFFDPTKRYSVVAIDSDRLMVLGWNKWLNLNLFTVPVDE